jgi:hypothetical protein
MRAQIEPFHAIAISRLAHQLKTEGASIIHMEFGQPSTGAPSKALAKAHEILDAEAMGYWESPALRARIAERYQTLYGVTVEPERIVLTCGASPALVLALSSVFTPGDRIALARPGYVAYRNSLKALHLEPRRDRLRAGGSFPADGEASRGSRPRPGRRHRRQPCQPDRHDHRARGAGGHRASLPRARNPHHQRRDLSRPQLHGPHALDAGVRARRPDRQQFQQVFQHGRLATGLAADAQGRGPWTGRGPMSATCS